MLPRHPGPEILRTDEIPRQNGDGTYPRDVDSPGVWDDPEGHTPHPEHQSRGLTTTTAPRSPVPVGTPERLWSEGGVRRGHVGLGPGRERDGE